jgi:hypothetical protein
MSVLDVLHTLAERLAGPPVRVQPGQAAAEAPGSCGERPHTHNRSHREPPVYHLPRRPIYDTSVTVALFTQRGVRAGRGALC